MSYDAIVVGARVAGAATATLLARRGLRVLMLDRAPAIGLDTLSTHALMRSGVLQLHRWGLLPSVAATTPALRTTTLHYGDRSEVVRLKPRAGVESLYAPRRTVIDPILARAAEEAGVEARYGVIVGGVLRRDGRVVGVEGLDRRRRPFQARAPLVVGADGMRSVVAREVGAPVTWEGTGASGMIYGYWEGLQADGYRWHYRPGATAGFIRTNEGRVCIWVGAPAHRFPALRREGLETAFHRLLQESAPEAVAAAAAARQVERLRGFQGVPGYLRRPWGTGWLGGNPARAPDAPGRAPHDGRPGGHRYRFLLRPHWAPERWHVIEQAGYCRVQDGVISRMDLACTGYFPIEADIA